MFATAQPAKRRLATYADIEALPPHLNGQIINGELLVSPRPAPPHFHAASMLNAQLITRFHLGEGGPGGWRIYFEPEVHLDGDVLIPDIAGWRIENWSDDIQTAAVQRTPDWICEVLSPSTERLDRVRKLATYARLGVAYAWLVHPTLHFVEVYVNQGGHWMRQTVAEGNGALSAVPFDAATISMRSLWLKPQDDAPPEATDAETPDAAPKDAPAPEGASE